MKYEPVLEVSSWDQAKVNRQILSDEVINELNKVAAFPAITDTSIAYRALMNAASLHLRSLNYAEAHINHLQNQILEMESKKNAN